MNESLKTIFAVIDAGDDWSRVEPLATICKTLNTHLTLLVIDLARPAVVSNYGKAQAIHTGTSFEHGLEATQAVAKRLQKKVDSLAISCDLTAASILPSEIEYLVAERARYADICICVSSIKGWSTVYERTIHSALTHSGKPVLTIPTNCESLDFKRPLIAWDGGVHSARAVHNALSLLSASQEVNAVLIDPPSSVPSVGSFLQQYLARHEISVGVHPVSRDGERISDLILQTAEKTNSDLIVAGGYGHSRRRERLFGGTTYRLLNNASLPLFLSH